MNPINPNQKFPANTDLSQLYPNKGSDNGEFADYDKYSGAGIQPGYHIPITREYLTSEVGQSGVQNYSGFLFNQPDEWLADFEDIFTRYQTVSYMRNDAIISAIEQGFFLPIEQADNHLEYDDKTLIQDPQYKKIHDFVASDFSNINMPSFLHNANNFMPFGFSTFEQCFDIQTDGLLHLTKLAPRMPKTAWKWLVDGHGNLETFIQYTYTVRPNGSMGGWRYIPIPAEKLLLITHQMEGGNFTGRMAYRPFYREWKIKDDTMKQLIIAIRRTGGGIPVAIVNKDAPEASATSGSGGINLSTVDQMVNVFKQLQANESSFIVGKGLDKLDLLAIDPNAIKGLLEVIQYCDESMAKAAFQMYMSLGTSNTGSRSLGDTFEGLYYMGLEGKAATICGAINEQVIKRLVDMNFGKQKAYPKFKLDIKQNMSAVLGLMGDLKRFGLISGNTDFENFVMNYYGLPATTKENILKPAVTMSMSGGGSSNTNPAGSLGMSEKKIELSGEPNTNDDKTLEQTIQEIMKKVTVNHSFDVPYLSGMNDSNTVCYIDHRLPLQYKAKSGRIVNVAPSLVMHEYTEKSLMDNGVEYAQAHAVALQSEEGLVRANGVDWNEYQDFMTNYYAQIIRGENSNLPPDLYMAPYNEMEYDVKISDKCEHEHEDLRLADVKVKRNPKLNVRGKMDFNKHAEEMTTMKRSLAMEMRHIIEPSMITKAKELSGGKKVYMTKVQWGNKVADLFRKYYARLLQKGKSDVKTELLKQNIKLMDKIELAEKKMPKNDTEYNDWSSEQSDLASSMLENDADQAVTSYYASGKAMGLTGEALQNFIVDQIMKEKGQRYLSGSDYIVGAYGLVREIAAKDFEDSVSSKTRTEIFDNNICDVCSDMDGLTYTKNSDGIYVDDDGNEAPEAPFADCVGANYGNQCRGIYVYN